MKSLKQIQSISKMGKIFSNIAFVCAIIGFCGCIVSLISLQLGAEEIFKVGNVTLHGLVEAGDYGMEGICGILAAWMIICAGEAVLAKFAEAYFKHELSDGTPFTQKGATELLRLGILTICIPLGTAVIADVVQAVVAGLMNTNTDFATDVCFDNEGMVALGVMFIVMSLLCRYGAEMVQGKTKKDYC